MFLCQKPHYITSLNATVLRCTSPKGKVEKKESDKYAYTFQINDKYV